MSRFSEHEIKRSYMNIIINMACLLPIRATVIVAEKKTIMFNVGKRFILN
jgi:hypothetical protein